MRDHAITIHTMPSNEKTPLRIEVFFILSFLMVGLIVFQSSQTFANSNPEKPKRGSKAATAHTNAPVNTGASVCSPALEANNQPDTDKPEARTTQAPTLYSFLEKDPKQNFGVIHPSTILIGAQNYLRVLGIVPPIHTYGMYQASPITIYPIFHGEHPASKDTKLEGQYVAIMEMVRDLKDAALGKRGGKVPMFLGPPGTGKTEIVNSLDRIRAYLTRHNPDFYEYTYEFVNLAEIKRLQKKLSDDPDMWSEETIVDEMGDSPFTLLRRDIQNEVLKMISPSLKQKTGFDVIAHTQPNPQTSRIIEVIFQHYFPEIRNRTKTIDELSPEEYLRVLSKHVRIFRKNSSSFGSSKLPSNLIRVQPKNPKYTQLFVSPDLNAALSFKIDDPLRYHYSGKILKLHRGIAGLDEFMRNDLGLMNTFLDGFQNKMIETEMGPPVYLDTFFILTSNDESILHAKENGTPLALLSRFDPIPFLWNLEPMQIEATAILSVNEKLFSMRELPKEGESIASKPLSPLDIRKLYPLPRGNQLARKIPHLVYFNDPGGPILLAPHALEMIALTAAASRFETRVAKFAEHKSELQFLSENFKKYTDPIQRLRVLLGQSNLDLEVRRDLEKASNLLEEGRSGLGAREVALWFNTALHEAASSENRALTPRIVASSFRNLMDRKKLSIAGKDRFEVLHLFELVKNEIILEELAGDIRRIVSGDGEKAQRLYDKIEKSIAARQVNPKATSFIPDNGGPPQVINDSELKKVFEHYKNRTQHEYNIAYLYQALQAGTPERKVRDSGLMQAIQDYLYETDMQIADSITDVTRYYRGEINTPEVAHQVMESQSRYAQNGYDQGSFLEAVQYWQTLVYERNKFESEHRH